MTGNQNPVRAGEKTLVFRKGPDGRPGAHCWQVADFLRMAHDELLRTIRDYDGSAAFRRENFIPTRTGYRITFRGVAVLAQAERQRLSRGNESAKRYR